jgi:hypothetical protein
MPANPPALDAAALLRACRNGRPVRGVRSVDAALVRAICRRDPGEIDPRGLVIEDARITGGLDLTGMAVPFPLRFVRCVFDEPLDLDGADLHLLALDDCTVPGVLANGLRVRRDLDLSRSRIVGDLRTPASTSSPAAVWLCESEIGGRLLCRDTYLESSGRAIQADRMTVGGTIRLLHRFEARGALRLIGARVAGSVDLTGASLTRPQQDLALDLGDCEIGGSVFLIDDQTGRRPLVRGRIDLGNARISGHVMIRNATIDPTGPVAGPAYSSGRSTGTAISAPGITVGGPLGIEGRCEINGGVDLSMGSFSTIQISGESSLAVPGGRALDLTNAELRSGLLIEEGTTVEGTLRLAGAHVRGDLRLRGTRWSNPEGNTVISAQSAVIDGMVHLREVSTSGGRLSLRAATVGGVVNARAARLHNPDGEALSLEQALVRGPVLLGAGFRADGVVVLNRCTAEGRLDCDGGTFTSGIKAVSATIREGMRLRWAEVPPRVDLTGTATTVLADDATRWPAETAISGFVYDRFDDGWDWRRRRDWLRSMSTYDAGPYEQAARVFRQHGRPVEAEYLLMELRRRAPRRGLVRGLIDYLYGVTVGYGYRPGRVLWLLAALLVMVYGMLLMPGVQATLRATDPRGNVYAADGRLVTVEAADPSPDGTAVESRLTHRPDACGDGQVRCFDPLFYTVDTVVPLLTLGQRATWYPETNTSGGSLVAVLLNLAGLLGWILSTVVVLSFARLARPA